MSDGAEQEPCYVVTVLKTIPVFNGEPPITGFDLSSGTYPLERVACPMGEAFMDWHVVVDTMIGISLDLWQQLADKGYVRLEVVEPVSASRATGS